MRRDRRTFLRRSSYAAAGAALSCVTTPRPPEASSDWGAALLTVRDILGSEPERTLAALAAIGYSKVELLPSQLGLIPQVKAAGLAAPSLLIDTPTITGDPSAWLGWPKLIRSPAGYRIDAAIDDAQKHGVHFLSAFYLMPQERSTLDSYRRFVEAMNLAGRKCRAAGLELCYHHHAFEFGELEGQLPMELLIQGFEPEHVGFELDVFWLSLAGRDPAEMIKRLGSRVRLLHLKDKAPGTPNELDDQKVSHDSFLEVGRGVIDFGGIVKASRQAGVVHAFVEQDHTSGDPLESLKASFKYLNDLAA